MIRVPRLQILALVAATAAAFPSYGRAQADSRPVPPTPDPRTDSRPAPAAPDAKTDSRPAPAAPDARTDSTPTPPQSSPDLRTDSKPNTAATPETDSKPADLGADTTHFLDLGFDPDTFAPAGMIAKSPDGNPLLLYLALEHRSGDTIVPADAALIASRQRDLDRAAALHGYDLKQAGWLYQQVVCPETEAGPDGPGVLVLHFVRRDDAKGTESLFTAIVPRDGRKVRAVAILHRNTTPFHAALHGGQNSSAVNEAIPAPALYQHLQPRADWVPTSACIAEMAGAYPHIPNDPDLDQEDRILTAPAPRLRLLLNGDRKVTFTDREDPDHYSIWDEWVEHTGRFREASHQRLNSPVLAITNPPGPTPQAVVTPAEPPIAYLTPPETQARSMIPAEPPVLPVTQPPTPTSFMLNPPQPPTIMMPPPPSPLSGEHQ